MVDDDIDSANSLAELLALLMQTVTVSTAYGGVDAVAAVTAKDACLDAVITDIEMPGLDGIAAANQMRQALGVATPVIIAVTGHAGLFELHGGRTNFDHVLLKPVGVDELLAILEPLRRV